jgi:hypothetical protein
LLAWWLGGLGSDFGKYLNKFGGLGSDLGKHLNKLNNIRGNSLEITLNPTVLILKSAL